MNVIDILTVTIVVVVVLFIISNRLSGRPQPMIPPLFSQLKWRPVTAIEEGGLEIMEMPAERTYKFVAWGKVAHMYFDNGFGLSVLRSHNSGGSRQGQYEIAVMRKLTAEEMDKRRSYEVERNLTHHITYDTDVAHDVVGYLREREVTEYLQRVWLLDKDGHESNE